MLKCYLLHGELAQHVGRDPALLIYIRFSTKKIFLLRKDFGLKTYFTANPIIVSHLFPVRSIGMFASCAGTSPPIP